MPSPRKEAARFVREIMEAHLQAFWDDLDYVWKPRLKAELGGAAVLGLQHLRRALAEQSAAPARPADLAASKFALGQAVLKIAAEQAATAQATLAQMVAAQTEALQNALTINGLAGDPQAMASRRRAQGRSLPRMATGPALAESVRRSALEFARKVFAALDQAGTSGPEAWPPLLEQAARSWQARLHAIAVTVAQASAGNVYDAVCRSLD
jgi:hypothetical protein